MKHIQLYFTYSIPEMCFEVLGWHLLTWLIFWCYPLAKNLSRSKGLYKPPVVFESS